jgi:hypothetical protein
MRLFSKNQLILLTAARALAVAESRKSGGGFGVPGLFASGAPDTIRTCDLCLRSNITCPSEKCDRARYYTLSS